MIRARRAALDSGVYEPLRDYLVTLAERRGGALDVGCGEGYFTRAVSDATDGWCGAIDTSTLAVRLAAGQDKSTEYAVADAFDLPLNDESVDVIWSVFGPVVPSEFGRVLRPGGRVIAVSPGPEHLWEIKQRLLDAPRLHEGRGPSGLNRIGAVRELDRLRFPLSLEPDLATTLFAMTPYARSHRLDRIQQPITVTADFVITESERRR